MTANALAENVTRQRCPRSVSDPVQPPPTIIGQPRYTFALRRWIAIGITAAASAALIWGHDLIRHSLGREAVFSGSVLAGCLLLLMLLGVRRRLIVLPLWPVSVWLQIHLYTGLFACIAFWLHVPTWIASGWFEGGLAMLFLSVSASGFYGILLSRSAPRKLTGLSVQPRFDRIVWHRGQLAIAADEAISALPESADRCVIETYYRRTLKPYFASRPSWHYLLHPTGVQRRRLLAELNELGRYIDRDVSSTRDRLAAFIRHRDDLDYHRAMGYRLRGWLVIHTAASLVLAGWSLVHVVIATGMIH